MELESFSALDEGITKEDWRRTPASVQHLLRWLFEDFENRLIDLEEDKTLSRIENELSSESKTEGQPEAPEKQRESRCSFCGKTSKEVLKLIAGPNVNICNECIEICNEILSDDLAPDTK
jgi:hypothetical protein